MSRAAMNRRKKSQSQAVQVLDLAHTL
jgi:hypothetical protein